MWFIIEKGGIFIWPLLACSVMAAAIILDRAFVFIRNRARSSKLIKDVIENVRKGDIEKALDLCHHIRGPFARIGSVYLENLHLRRQDREELLHREGSMELERLEQHLNKLSTIAQISPLLGLLGTVTGMIRAFQRIQAMGGQVDIEVLAGGIWEALLTTAVGLTIAIPTMAMYSYFESRVDKIQAKMHYFIMTLNELLNFGSIADRKHKIGHRET
jgi:biopolymer transport protein ExbB